MPPRESRVPSSAVPQTRREARQRQRQIARLAEQRAGFEEVDEQQDLEFEGGEFVPDEQAVDEAEQNVAEETASQQPFVKPGDIDVGINENTLTAEASLTEEGRAAAQQRQNEELRSEAAKDSDRFGASDFTVDRSGEEIEVEPTETAVDRERREDAASQLESDTTLNDIDPNTDLVSTDDGLQLTKSLRKQDAINQFDDEYDSVDITSDDVTVTDGTVTLNDETVDSIKVNQAASQFESAANSIDETVSEIQVDQGDIQRTEDGFALDNEAQRRLAAAEIPGVSASELQRTEDGSFERSDASREAAFADQQPELIKLTDTQVDTIADSGQVSAIEIAQLRSAVDDGELVNPTEFDSFNPAEFGSVDFERTDFAIDDVTTGSEIDQDAIQRARESDAFDATDVAQLIAASESRSAVDSNVAEQLDGVETQISITDDKQQEIAVTQIDRQLENVDVTADDITTVNGSFAPTEGILEDSAAASLDSRVLVDEEAAESLTDDVGSIEAAELLDAADGGDLVDPDNFDSVDLESRDGVETVDYGADDFELGVRPSADTIQQDGVSSIEQAQLQAAASEGRIVDPNEFESLDRSDASVSLSADKRASVSARQFDQQLTDIDVGVEDVEPDNGGSFGLDDATQDQLSDQQRQEFANALESGDAFESGEAPDALGDIDPQTDISIEDGSLTLADETQADLVESQIRSQTDSDVGLPSVGVGSIVAQENDIRKQIAKEFAAQNDNVEFSENLSRDVLPTSPRGEGRAVVTPNFVERTNDGSTEFEVFRVALGGELLETVPSTPQKTFVRDPVDGQVEDAQYAAPAGDVGEALNTDDTFDAADVLSDELERDAADELDDRLPSVDVSTSDVTQSDGSFELSDDIRSKFEIGSDQITADGLSESGQADFARRQLRSIQSTEGVSVETPVDSDAFANVSATLSQAADGDGSLSSATRIVAASEAVDDTGDIADLSSAQIIEGLEPDQADKRLGIDAETVREAQTDIQQRRQQLNNDPQQVLESIADNSDDFIEGSTRIGVGAERGQRIRQTARAQLNEVETEIAAGDGDVSADDVDLSLTDDLSGIRSVNQAGRQAIAQSVDDELANFGAEEIEVGLSDGQITTSIEDSVRERFIQNAQRVQEIQARNEIADSTEGIGRRDIEVDAGEGISPSDELVTETLGTDVNADIESFDQLQSAAETQARFEARQQAIDQVESQTIGSVYPGNVTVERTETGFEANVSGAAAQSVDLSAVDAGQTTTVQTTNQTDTNVSLGNLSNVTGAVGLNTPEQIDTGSGEQFGDAVPDFIEDPARGFQSGVSQIGAQLGGGVGNVVEQVGEFSAPVEQGTNVVGQTPAESTGNLAEGAIEGTANLIGSAPVVGVEATEFGIFAVQNPGETASQLPDAISERALLAGEQATSSPAEFTGQVVGSGAGSGALFKATQGTRLGTVTRATLQPGEELVKAGVRRGALGERAVDVTPGVTRGQIDRDFGSERGQTSPLLGAERLLDDSGDGDTTIEIEDTGPRADVENDPRTGLDDIEQAAARGRQRSVDIDQDIDTSVRSVTRDQDIQSVTQDAEIRSPSRSVGGGSDSRPISEIDPDLTPRETQLAAQLDTPTGDFRRRVDIEDRTPDIDLRQRGRGETGSVTELISRTEATTDTVAVEQQTPEVAFDSEPGSVNAGGELAETVETGVETSVESQFRQSVGETGQQRFFEREQVGVKPGSDTDTRLGVTPGSDIGVGSQPRTGVETGVGADARTAIDSRAESRTGLETGVETGVGADARTAIDSRAESRTGLETGVETAVETTAETTTGLETGIETQIETEREREFEIGLEREPESESEARRRRERAEESQSGAGFETALDSEVAEFDFLTLDQTDDRIEDVLG